MKVGDLVRHWRRSICGLGIIVEKEQIAHITNYKVQWSGDGGWGWYEHDRLEVLNESR